MEFPCWVQCRAPLLLFILSQPHGVLPSPKGTYFLPLDAEKQPPWNESLRSNFQECNKLIWGNYQGNTSSFLIYILYIIHGCRPVHICPPPCVGKVMFSINLPPIPWERNKMPNESAGSVSDVARLAIIQITLWRFRRALKYPASVCLHILNLASQQPGWQPVFGLPYCTFFHHMLL